MRKRVQDAGKDSIHDTLEGREERFVRDRLHKVSRHIVAWSRQFEKPCIVFEDLKEIRDSIDYGTRMNRRLHHLPFRALQFYTSYKASFEEIPTAWIDPYKTSQRCPMCGHPERANHNKKRFTCRSCEHQNHADRSASVNIAVKRVKKLDWTVPTLNSLPQVRKVRRQASGAVDAPTVRGNPTDGRVGCPTNPREASGLPPGRFTRQPASTRTTTRRGSARSSRTGSRSSEGSDRPLERRCLPAVDDEFGAGHVGGHVAREEDDGLPDLRRVRVPV